MKLAPFDSGPTHNLQENDMNERASANVQRGADSFDAKKERLIEDAGEVVKDISGRVESSLNNAKASLTKAQDAVNTQARYAADYTDQYVHDNPWKSIGFAAVVGLLVGVLVSGRR
jgi:ElaB/YqjD/DUF883 family membrane-anchored ribosome-binding protein